MMGITNTSIHYLVKPTGCHRQPQRLSIRVGSTARQEKDSGAGISSDLDRRTAMSSILALVPLSLSSSLVEACGPLTGVAEAKQASRIAGDFCAPSSNKDGFVVYKPDSRATPAIRAGVIQPSPDLYSFELPASWSEGTILNILSGNFCMPKCDEPWIETLWESKEDGFCQLVVSPLFRLVSKSNATLQDLGKPEQVIESVGAFVTGNYLDSIEDVTAIQTEKFQDGREYYTYELFAPYAKTGSHFQAAITVKDDLAYLFVTGASDRQWANSADTLKYVLRSFKAA